MQLTTEIAQREGSFIVEQSKALIINTPAAEEYAIEGLKLIKGYASRIDTELILPWRKQKASAEAERKRLTELLIDPLKDAEQILKRKQIDYVTGYRKTIMAISQWIDALNYIKINEGELNRLANKTKGKLSINGVEVYEDKILRSSKD
jgi:hypothetical protein